MNRKEVADKLAKNLKVSKAEAARTLDAVIEVFEHALVRSKDSEVKLSGFGVLSVRKRKPRVARNMATGEKMMTKESLTVKFKPGKGLKAALAAKLEARSAKPAESTETATPAEQPAEAVAAA